MQITSIRLPPLGKHQKHIAVAADRQFSGPALTVTQAQSKYWTTTVTHHYKRTTDAGAHRSMATV
jgi:hypothetical protein